METYDINKLDTLKFRRVFDNWAWYQKGPILAELSSPKAALAGFKGATERALRAIEKIKAHVVWNHSEHTMMEKYLNEAIKLIEEDENL